MAEEDFLWGSFFGVVVPFLVIGILTTLEIERRDLDDDSVTG